MRVAPELVFINCCHLGAFPAKARLYDRVGFASGVARTLIDLGVRCVVAAGWAIDDASASDFATTSTGRNSASPDPVNCPRYDATPAGSNEASPAVGEMMVHGTTSLHKVRVLYLRTTGFSPSRWSRF